MIIVKNSKGLYKPKWFEFHQFKMREKKIRIMLNFSFFTNLMNFALLIIMTIWMLNLENLGDLLDVQALGIVKKNITGSLSKI